jgi:hypothetical protein
MASLVADQRAQETERSPRGRPISAWWVLAIFAFLA